MAHPPLCRCHELSVLRTSWTEDNPGRRFFTCARRYEVSKVKCDFFTWADDPIEDRAKEVINGLLRKLNRYERQLRVQGTGMSSRNESEQSASSFNWTGGARGVDEMNAKESGRLYIMCLAVVVGVVSGILCNKIFV
ncbi:hypothetical protein LINPERHAP1_LOCUS16740 [Linum perenne]